LTDDADSDEALSLDRGLDIFQRYDMNDAFDFANRLQQYRACRAFEVTYLRIEATNESGDDR
jgi:ATP-dependent Lon protease